ncbi:ABC transporter permease [Carbonactinospora thermoautotrophica]|uniref:ABC transporter permease n=1 Tax=Carbonactinospora thermoautotrophica TaxID=1469144 RepID=UPI00226E7ED7|nr:ABC transporter permease [Carbonactinospora thermoautotrophica]MCX9190367.1 ABC transporter permease [Carbonactinospora thermoautotrophica]
MGAILIRRACVAPLVLVGVSLLAFALPALTGEDPARAVLRARLAEVPPDPATLAAISRELGLDRPWPLRYLSWLGDLARGQLGLSYETRTPVADLLVRATGVSLALMLTALLYALLAGVAAGAWAAARPGGWVDRFVGAASQAAVVVPEYVLGPLLVLVFAVWLRWLPATGWHTTANAVLPSVTLAIPAAAFIARLVRAEAVDTSTQPFVRTAWAKGLPARRVLWRHVIRASLASTTAFGSVFFGGLLGGSVLVEVVFGIQGLGGLLHDAVQAQDVPVLQAGLLVAVAVAMLLGLAGDLLQMLLDPIARERGAR